MYHYGMKSKWWCAIITCLGRLKFLISRSKQWTLQHVLVRTDDVAECTKFPQSSKQYPGVSQLAPSAALLSSDLRSPAWFIHFTKCSRRFFVVLTHGSATHPLSRTMLSPIIYRQKSREAIKATLITIAPLLSPFNALFPIDRTTTEWRD